MAQPPSHQLRRQTWRLRVATEATGSRARAAVRRLAEDHAEGLFERVLDRHANSDEVLRIPKIEVRVRLPLSDHFEDRLGESVADALDQALRHRIAALESTFTFRRRSVRADRRDTLLAYLSTGRTDHAVSRGRAAILEELKLEAASLASEGLTGLLRWLRLITPASREEEAARLVALLGEDSRSALVKLATTAHDHFPLANQATGADGAEASHAPPDSRGPGGSSPGESHRVPRSGRYLARLLVLLASGERIPPPPAPADPAQPTPSSVDHDVGDNPNIATRNATAKDRSPATARSNTHPTRPESAFDGPAREMKLSEAPPTHARADAPARWTALDAGLVLLHPFIPTLLDAIGATDGTPKRIRDGSRAHAAAVLHHLLTGTECSYEFELTVIKLMLGISPGDPLHIGDAEITDADRAECQALLVAATTHWSALRGSSVDSLRSAFLDRTGILRDVGPGWVLAVEGKPFDALLSTVPWNTSLVILPWMTKPLQVDWPKV